jgi:hypothetical protein
MFKELVVVSLSIKELDADQHDPTMTCSEVIQMARSKGAAPDKAVTNEPLEQPVLETAEEIQSLDDTVSETVMAEAIEAEPENAVYAVVMSGVSRAQEAFKAVPNVGENVRKVAYKGIYYASFGATFGALVVAQLVPSESFVGQAMAEGAKAAKASFRRQRAAEVARQAAEASAMPA